MVSPAVSVAGVPSGAAASAAKEEVAQGTLQYENGHESDPVCRGVKLAETSLRSLRV